MEQSNTKLRQPIRSKEIKLIVAATINWPSTSAGGTNFLKYQNQPGVTPSPPPYMEVKAANGSWVRVPDDREFPLPDVTDDVFVVNMTGLFPTNDYSIRINTYQDIRFDYIGVDTTPQQNLNVQSILPSSADFQQIYATGSNSSGAFTKYGDVTALVLSADDQFVIGREGDGVQLKFPANLPPVAPGMERDLLLCCQRMVQGKRLVLCSLHGEPDALPSHDQLSLPIQRVLPLRCNPPILPLQIRHQGNNALK